MSEQIKQALTLLTTYLRKHETIPQSLEDEVCNLLGYDVESGPVIPAGWRLVNEGESTLGIDYVYSKLANGWIQYSSNLGRTAALSNHVFITQTINIDLSKQPKELVAFARHKCGSWSGFNYVPEPLNATWRYDGKIVETCRDLLKSEEPTNCNAHWEDSLLVRPEAMYEGTK